MRARLMLSLWLLALLLCGCCSQPEQGPDQAVLAYLDAVFSLDGQKAYQLLCRADQQSVSFEQFWPADLSAQLAAQKELFETFKIKLVNRVLSVESDGKQASVVVESVQPDVKLLLADLFRLGQRAVFDPHADVFELMAALVDKYQTQGLPHATRQQTYELKLERGEWRVCFGTLGDAKPGL